MRPSALPTLAAFIVVAGLAAAALASSCFQPPPVDGPYRCNAGQACPAPYTCDDGICCIFGAGATPECPSYVAPNGKCSDGGTPRVYFKDLDEDGYGANGSGHVACQDPGSYHFALDAGDCNDSPADGGAAFHPGAPDVCDGKDNNCNGQTDEPPTCGGPRSLFIDPAITTVGAKKLTANWFNGTPPRCLRDDAEDPNAAADAVNQFTGTWSGSRSTTHVLWSQAPAGITWDLSAPGVTLRLTGTVKVASANAGGNPGWIWYPAPQPWIMLCGPAGFLRLALPAGQSLFSLTDPTLALFDDTFPVRGGNGWAIQPGSSTDPDAVLRQVEHVEVLDELYPAAGGPSFDIDFDEALVGFQ